MVADEPHQSDADIFAPFGILKSELFRFDE
jgi:hypothetical protein